MSELLPCPFCKAGKPYKVWGIRKEDGVRVFIGNETTLY